MEKFMLGKKAGMTQIFDESGAAVPVTVIECGPVSVLQKKTVEVDGYSAVKFGFADKKEKLVNKPDMGQFKKAGVTPKRFIKEAHTDALEAYELGQNVLVSDVFVVGDRVDVSGVSKGKGYQGNIKRHGQKGGKETHGSMYHRRVGSMGANTDPARVFKGKKMPGHMGAENVTVQNLDVVFVDGERNIIALKGAVPGPKGGYLTIKATVKKK